MDGPCAKVNLVLDAEPQVRGMPADAGPGQRALFTLPPDLAVADACYDRAKRGELAGAEQLFVDCVVASTVDPSLARAGLATLVVEARGVAGGCCVTEEIAPGCRASTTSYIASMLRPEVIRALDLGRHGLRMVPCEPALQVALDDGEVLADWNDPARTAAGIARYSPADARAFASVHAELAQLASRLQPLFMELPPDTRATGLRLAAPRRCGWAATCAACAAPTWRA